VQRSRGEVFTVNFPFVVVVIACICGLASELALRTIAPQAGPAVALMLMATALIVGGRLLARRPEPKRARSRTRSATESLNPI
jgi:hypothetical protein